MKKYNFTKINGAGNDFIAFDLDEYPNFRLTRSIIVELCHRRFGIGADGIITIKKAKDADFIMEYYNSDGSLGSLCGNGSRSAIMFAYLKGKTSSKNVKFKVSENSYSGEVLSENLVRFDLNQPSMLELNLDIQVSEGSIVGSFIDTGSPHVIIFTDDIPFVQGGIEKLNVIELGKEIRYSNLFSPAGTNVNFIEKIGEEIFIRTYERGVEDETLACGTGSTAAGIISFLKKQLKPPIKLRTHGGDLLQIDFEYKNSEFHHLSLIGPVKVNFLGTIEINE